jgi:hypothetical protein
MQTQQRIIKTCSSDMVASPVWSASEFPGFATRDGFWPASGCNSRLWGATDGESRARRTAFAEGVCLHSRTIVASPAIVIVKGSPPMTHARDPRSFATAAFKAISALGPAEIREIINATVSTRQIYRYGEPEARVPFTLGEAYLIDAEVKRRTGATPFLDALAAKLAAAEGRRDVGELDDEVLDLAAALGNLSRDLRRARDRHGPGGHVLTSTERTTLETHVERFKSELADFEASLEESCPRDAAPRLVER